MKYLVGIRRLFGLKKLIVLFVTQDTQFDEVQFVLKETTQIKNHSKDKMEQMIYQIELCFFLVETKFLKILK